MTFHRIVLAVVGAAFLSVAPPPSGAQEIPEDIGAKIKDEKKARQGVGTQAGPPGSPAQRRGDVMQSKQGQMMGKGKGGDGGKGGKKSMTMKSKDGGGGKGGDGKGGKKGMMIREQRRTRAHQQMQGAAAQRQGQAGAVQGEALRPEGTAAGQQMRPPASAQERVREQQRQGQAPPR